MSTLVIKNVDMAKLEKQRLGLVDIVCNRGEGAIVDAFGMETLEGLLNMLDSWADKVELLAEMMPIEEVSEAMESNMLEQEDDQ